MGTLARDLRKRLERTVIDARRTAEAGARKVLEQLGVHHHEPWPSLTPEQRNLRTRLRAHGRQLGDRRDEKRGTQTIDRLIGECAYEHWHRMLFARFLAETDLLIEPESGVAVSLDEAQELAREREQDWLELASTFAERMLPQIFRKGDPVLDIALLPETRSDLEDLLKGLPREVFLADDSLGWVYQFWQSEMKEAINKSEKKIGADELPAVTQLFTEDYMVLFLLHNTLGAWWAGKVLAARPELAESAKSEDELRAACKVGDVEWTYLRFVRDKTNDGDEGPWRPAAGTFDGWPKAAKDITVVDPCMGSGHFLVFALPILVAFRMVEEGLSREAAVEAVLRDNLFGLEIDQRCTQIAAFNLAFAAWRAVGYRPLPKLNLACSGLAIGVTKGEWLRLAEKAVTAADPAAKRDLLGVEKNLLTVGLEERVKNGLEALYDLFARAPWLGSLIDPRHAGADIFREGFDKLEPLLASILAVVETDEAREMAVAARGMAKAAELLGGQYCLVTTNVPYLGRAKHDNLLKNHCEQHFPLSKADLATCFVERLFAVCCSGGAISVVTPQNWLFLGRYAKMRRVFLREQDWKFVATLGPRAFEAISGEIVNVAMLTISKSKPGTRASYSGIDAVGAPSAFDKAEVVRSASLLKTLQSDALGSPDHRIVFGSQSTLALLGKFARGNAGMRSGDAPQFILCFWELPKIANGWLPQRSTTRETTLISGCEHVIHWEDGRGRYYEYMQAQARDGYRSGVWKAGDQVWGLRGVLVSQIGDLNASLYYGEAFDNNVSALVPFEQNLVPALWAYCSSDEFRAEVRAIDKKLNVTSATLVKVPFAIERWENTAKRLFPVGLPAPKSTDPTQWIHSGDIKSSSHPLIVVTARLLGYQWPRQTGSSFMDCSAVGPDGLEKHANEDGIVCLTALKGEPPAEQRLNAHLANGFGPEWSAAKLAGLLAEAGFAGKTLDDWLRDGFFEQQCALFHQRPLIWHIWDGRRDGFHALVNYHRLAAPGGEGRRTLEKLIYSYLGDWIDRQRAQQKAAVEGADARVAHAEHLRAELIKILEGEPPYDIFVRWKPIHEQPIGWEPDINDGVRMNIRPFVTARPLNARGVNACILRRTPKIKWDKDRGKEPTREKDDYPSFWGWEGRTQNFTGGKTFDGNRWNDLHYTVAHKRAARARKTGS